MNPTGRNIASQKTWHGLKSPWIGTKNIWDLFSAVNLIDEELYKTIKKIPGSSWTEEFATLVYDDVAKHKVFITNLGKCTQVDARPLPDRVYKEYLDLLLKEIEIVNPKVIILFGNQVSSIVLNKKISVSASRKEMHPLKIKDKTVLKELNEYIVTYKLLANKKELKYFLNKYNEYDKINGNKSKFLLIFLLE